MLVAGDLSGLEWQVAAFLSQDAVMLEELWAGRDPHEATGKEHFDGEGERVHWKIFNFRLIYGGGAYAFFKDAKMPNFSQNRWKAIVESFFKRYSGLAKWHSTVAKIVNDCGQYQGPTGRVWKFQLYPNKRTGAMEYRLPQIKNYPVQGTATADFAPLAICEIWKRMRVETPGSLVVNLVHDEIICDCPEHEWKKVAKLIVNAYDELPRLIEQFFPGITECNIPLGGDAKFGHSWGAMAPFEG